MHWAEKLSDHLSSVELAEKEQMKVKLFTTENKEISYEATLI